MTRRAEEKVGRLGSLGTRRTDFPIRCGLPSAVLRGAWPRRARILCLADHDRAGGMGVGEAVDHVDVAGQFWASLQEIADELPGRADEIEAAGEVPRDVVDRL